MISDGRIDLTEHRDFSRRGNVLDWSNSRYSLIQTQYFELMDALVDIEDIMFTDDSENPDENIHMHISSFLDKMLWSERSELRTDIFGIRHVLSQASTIFNYSKQFDEDVATHCERCGAYIPIPWKWNKYHGVCKECNDIMLEDYEGKVPWKRGSFGRNADTDDRAVLNYR